MLLFAGVLHAPENPCKPSCRPRMAEDRGSSPPGSALFFRDLPVKREEQKEVPACSRALVQQSSGTTGSYSKSQTTFPPNCLRVHALLACVRANHCAAYACGLPFPLAKRFAARQAEKDRYVRVYAQGRISEEELEHRSSSPFSVKSRPSNWEAPPNFGRFRIRLP